MFFFFDKREGIDSYDDQYVQDGLVCDVGGVCYLVYIGFLGEQDVYCCYVFFWCNGLDINFEEKKINVNNL